MTARWRWIFAVAVAPAVVGGLYWLGVYQFTWFSDYVIYSRISVGILTLWASVLFSAIFLAAALATWRATVIGRRDVYQAIEEANTAHRTFLLRLDHELKNPLTSMQVETANLEAIVPEQEGNLRPIGNLKLQTGRLIELVLQLRKLAELDAQSLEFSPVDLGEILTDLVTDFQLTPSGMSRQLMLALPEVPWPLPQVSGDPDLIYLALHNVLGNAVKYTRAGDRVQVRAFEDDRAAVVEVADSGPGIPEDELPHVWEELYRGKAARGTPGSGLGLALVKVIVERHGGSIAIRSRISQGTVVSIRFPVNV